jgi:hypothetical protein
MSRSDDLVRLHHILDAATKAPSILGERSLEQLRASERDRLAFVEVSGSQSNVDYSGTNEMRFAFSYGGRQAGTSMVTYACDAAGSAATSAMDDVSGDADAEIEYQIGVCDTTAGKDAMTRITAKKSLADNDSQSIEDHKQGTLSFTAQPGHAYFVFFAASVSGDSYRGSSRADMKISNIGNLSISFSQ